MDVVDALVFRIGAQWFGAPLATVVEVTPIVAIARQPDKGGERLGWLDLRGDTVPVIDPARILRIAAEPTASSDRLVILQVAEERLALPVQEVRGIEAVEVTTATARAGDGISPARLGPSAGGGLVQLIDPRILLSGPAARASRA